MKTKIIISVIAITLSLASCSYNSEGPSFKDKVGGWFNSFSLGLHSKKDKPVKDLSIVTSILGTLSNGMIARQMTQADLMYHRQALEEAYTAQINKTISWKNDESGHKGFITPLREGYQASTGNLCRQYKQAITANDTTESSVGTACQNYDGTWTIAH